MRFRKLFPYGQRVLNAGVEKWVLRPGADWYDPWQKGDFRYRISIAAKPWSVAESGSEGATPTRHGCLNRWLTIAVLTLGMRGFRGYLASPVTGMHFVCQLERMNSCAWSFWENSQKDSVKSLCHRLGSYRILSKQGQVKCCYNLMGFI